MITRCTRFGQKRPSVWIMGWLLWFLTLWFLSSGTPAPENTPDIPHLDKVAHFGFFFGGGGLLCAWLTHQFKKLNVFSCIVITTVVGSVVGMIDEYHQTFTPGRTGNDMGDWTADTLGGLTGAVVMTLLLKFTASRNSQKPPKATHLEGSS